MLCALRVRPRGEWPSEGFSESRKAAKGLPPLWRPFSASLVVTLTCCDPYFRRRRWDLNPRMRVLQTLALPLGYVAEIAVSLPPSAISNTLGWGVLADC